MKVAGNPVGKVRSVKVIDNLVKSLIAKWEKDHPDKPPKWWQFWKKGHTIYDGIAFLLDALNALIIAIEQEVATGPEKKAIVLAACEAIYDIVISPFLPLWLYPWSGTIKQFVIYILISTIIDFIVGKYRIGVWVVQKTQM
jgi:fatty acid desaturase